MSIWNAPAYVLIRLAQDLHVFDESMEKATNGATKAAVLQKMLEELSQRGYEGNYDIEDIRKWFGGTQVPDENQIKDLDEIHVDFSQDPSLHDPEIEELMQKVEPDPKKDATKDLPVIRKRKPKTWEQKQAQEVIDYIEKHELKAAQLPQKIDQDIGIMFCSP